MGRDSVGIDIDTRTALLAIDRVGMWLHIDWPPADYTLPTLPAGNPTPGAYTPWITDPQAQHILNAIIALLHPLPAPPTPPSRHNGAQSHEVPGQLSLETVP
jgi:hypothetical protein